MKKGDSNMKNIVLCGSMKVKEDIIKLATVLEKSDYHVLLPIECMNGVKKNIASKAHFDRIANPQNEIILVVNATKNNIKNYIGPNSFAEIALGFYFHKKVYLWNDIYEPYLDELIAWNVTPLKGDITRIAS